MANTYIYELRGKLYFNITNSCDNDCEFCLRGYETGVGGHELWLHYEPTNDVLIEALKNANLQDYSEVTFCGFGEPTQNIDGLFAMAEYMKKHYPKLSIRINTNGLANLSSGEDVTPKLAQLIDSVSISLNATNPQDYQRISRSIYGTKAFDGLLDFAKKANERGIKVVFTVLDNISDDEMDKSKDLAKSVGAKLRIRPFIS